MWALLMSQLPLVLPAPPVTLSLRVLTSPLGDIRCCWKMDWTQLCTATETPCARCQTSKKMLRSLAVDQCYYIRLQTESRLCVHRPPHVVSLRTFVLFYDISNVFLFLWLLTVKKAMPVHLVLILVLLSVIFFYIC